jgi:hypothetical protein
MCRVNEIETGSGGRKARERQGEAEDGSLRSESYMRSGKNFKPSFSLHLQPSPDMDLDDVAIFNLGILHKLVWI